ncbi:dihydropteroate synthase [Gracilibacillus ureilyticus]|uniref:Dihydropteroate synthase n=1 Tax=Gracilibacillus ureilyticus TaxID=531814 RepID=A0A1H9VLW4_9BACI|nr:dihydropteroate synthase [Gracilibacillus ureilyticus]SES22554.1 dihydropteroate synthase [Gracilibacillus ureilyticus]
MSEWLRTKVKDFHYSKQTLIMGILNITPDSFSDGGNYSTVEKAVEQAKRMEQDGAHIIDIGGESTRPGHKAVSEKEELARVIPVIETLSNEVNLPISIDTYKAEVAKQAVNAGASIINDVWGAKREPKIAKVAAEYNVPIILMHNRKEAVYQSFVEDMLSDVKESVQIALDAGVDRNNIILDPGVGFAKSYEQNILAMKNLDKLKQLGYPVLLATSRKSVIGQTLDLPVDQRDEGTGATVCFGINKGVELVRVHNVEMTVRMAKMMDVLIGKGSDLNG